MKRLLSIVILAGAVTLVASGCSHNPNTAYVGSGVPTTLPPPLPATPPPPQLPATMPPDQRQAAITQYDQNYQSAVDRRNDLIAKIKAMQVAQQQHQQTQ